MRLLYYRISNMFSPICKGFIASYKANLRRSLLPSSEQDNLEQRKERAHRGIQHPNPFTLKSSVCFLFPRAAIQSEGAQKDRLVSCQFLSLFVCFLLSHRRQIVSVLPRYLVKSQSLLYALRICQKE